MKKSTFILLIFVLFSLVMATCYYDNEEYLYPSLAGPCDTTIVNYNNVIKPVLRDNCMSCHSNANSAFGGGIAFETYTDVKARSAAIMPAIDHTGPVPMPPSGRLDQCAVNIFRIWIRRGMPE